MKIKIEHIAPILAEVCKMYLEECEKIEQLEIDSVTVIIHGEPYSCVAGGGFVNAESGVHILDEKEAATIIALLANKFEEIQSIQHVAPTKH